MQYPETLVEENIMENATIQKYDGKTVKVVKSLYRIEVIATPGEISVYGGDWNGLV